MSIPEAHKARYAYHFSHIDNLPKLLKTGFLANNHPNFPKTGCRSIASSDIQERRSKMKVPCGPGGFVHDYVPLYFGARSPMLLGVINEKNVDQSEILYFEFPVTLLEKHNAVFSDASANTVAPPNFFCDISDLDKLDWAAIDTLKWGNSDDAFRHRRMAELLVHLELPLSAASSCVVWNEDIKKRVEKIVAKAGVKFPPVTFEDSDRRHWFTNFQESKNDSCVTGPREIAQIFEAVSEYLKDNCGKHSETAEFPNLRKLLEGLEANFGCLSHTAELVGLKSANGFHKYTVDVHTQDVVAKLLALPKYGSLRPKQKEMVKLAAYLHDIGKGPKSRWDANGGL